MNIIFLTNSIAKTYTNDYINYVGSALSYSKQLYFDNMIRALNQHNKIIPIVWRTKGNDGKKGILEAAKVSGHKIIYHYSAINFKEFKNSRKALKSLQNDVFEFVKNDETYLILFDASYPLFRKFAKKLRKIQNIKTVAVCYEEKSLLPNPRTTEKYIKRTLKSVQGYIGRAQFLSAEEIKNTFLLPGFILKNEFSDRKALGTYVLYNGNLNTDVNVFSLINAYKRIRTNVTLIITGEGLLVPRVQEEAKADSRILYLNNIKDEDFWALESNSLFNISLSNTNTSNLEKPVIIRDLQFVHTGRPLISSLKIQIQKDFKKEICWVDPLESPLQTTLAEMLVKTTEELDKIGASLKKKAKKIFNVDILLENLEKFLNNI